LVKTETRFLLFDYFYGYVFSENDDLATMITVDSIFGFTTHKMNVRFRTNRRLIPQWKLSIEQFQKHLNYERCFNEVITIGTWYEHLLARKDSNQLIAFKEHVRIIKSQS
jgi:hypothetical protein